MAPCPGATVDPQFGGQVIPPWLGSGMLFCIFSSWHCVIRPPSVLPQRAGLEEPPTCRYPSGQEPHTERMFAPSGTHCTTVGSPSLQIFASVVTPVVA